MVARFDDEAETEADALAALQAAEVDRRLRFPDPLRSSRHSVSLDGFSLHAGVRVHANDPQGLERLCRYVVRPPFALRRLSAGEDGRLVYRIKRPRGGSLASASSPVKPPRRHDRPTRSYRVPWTARAQAPPDALDPAPSHDGTAPVFPD